MKITNEEIKKELSDFAKKHELELITKGEVGFGRECVGFIKERKYVDHNPIDMETFDYMTEYEDERIFPPDEVDAYHKYNCLAVLVHNGDFDEGLRQLHIWITYLESLGKIEIVRYRNGSTGMQAMFSGTHSYVLTIKDK